MTKKTLLLALVLGLFSFGFGQPKISNIEFPNSVDLFGLFEVAFQMDSYSNPYDPDVIDVYAEFLGPDDKPFKVNGFYFEEYDFTEYKGYEMASAGRARGWRVRFTPDQTGTWTFKICAIDQNGKMELTSNGLSDMTFKCDAVASANGFISLANTRYMKREVVEDGQKTQRPYFPIGPNVAWYSYVGNKNYPKGIFDYERYVDLLSGSANYMRIWLNRYQYLSLYGPEYANLNGKSVMYFDSTLNQKDAAELDHIVSYAAQHGITLMPCIFSFGDFLDDGTFKGDASQWNNNPYRNVLGLKSPTDFFTDKKAIKVEKNLIRYIVARWGYATNITCWELWNEVDNIPAGDLPLQTHYDNITEWHSEMARYIRAIDPFHHPISTSTATSARRNGFYEFLYANLDFIQIHTYGNIQKAKSKEERSYQMFEYANKGYGLYPDKPYFIGEFAFGQSFTDLKYKDKDPFGFDLHNCIWASMVSTSMGPASFWYWDYLEKHNLFHIYGPLLKFCENIPLLSDSFTAKCTASLGKRSTIFPNGIQTQYMINAAEDTIYGWCQDTAFSYQSLRRMTDEVGKNGHFVNDGVFDPKGYVYTKNVDAKPQPCSRRNTIDIPIGNQPVGTKYIVKWFDTETGEELLSERMAVKVKKGFLWGKKISIEFPSSVRDVKNMKINNSCGDAAFIIHAEQEPQEQDNMR